MCVVNKQFELLEFVFDSVYVDLQYVEIYLTLLLMGLCSCVLFSHMVVFGLSVRLALLFAFQPMFISIWVSRLEIAEFPDSIRRTAP